jgi:hypothetical protein
MRPIVSRTIPLSLLLVLVQTQHYVLSLSTTGIQDISSESTRRSFLNKVVIGTTTTTTVYSWGLSVPSSFAASTTGQKISIANRLSDDILYLPPPSYVSELNGIDNTYFPTYLAGEWDVTQTLVETKTPLGLKFLGGPNGNEEIARKANEEANSKLSIPVQLRLRYVQTKWGVAEDRLFNNQQRLNAFARKNVVASVQYADVGGSNRQSVLALGGTSEDPLQTTVVYFKGPAAQKSFVTSHGCETLSDSSWAGFEVQVSLLLNDFY